MEIPLQFVLCVVGMMTFACGGVCNSPVSAEAADAVRAAPARLTGRIVVPLKQPAQLLDVLCDSGVLGKYTFSKLSFAEVIASGAAGPNALYERGERDKWYIEGQRNVAERMESLVINKLVRGVDIGALPDVDRMLKWAFDRQAPDGGFPGSDDSFHSGEIFVNSVARGFLLIRQSKVPEFQYIVDKYLEKLCLAAHWFIDAPAAKQGRERNKPFTHRRYIMAEGLGTVAVLTGDKLLEAAALEFAREGIALLRPDGISPELGGFDTNYANAGMLQAMRYWFVCPDAQVREGLLKVARVSLDRVGVRVGDDGSVNVAGDTRVGPNHINRDGKPKKFNRPEGMYSFTLGYYLLGDENLLLKAENIAKGL